MRVAKGAIVGVAENGSAAVLVTVADGTVIDRREIELIDPGMPTHPYHHQGSWAVGRYLDSPWAKKISLSDAIALVKAGKKVAARRARESLNTLARDVSATITGIVLRECAVMPATIEARIRDNRAQTTADTVMYRQALAAAAAKRGWAVSWYDRDDVFDDATKMLGVKSADAALKAMGKVVGSPWRSQEKLAAAAALAASVKKR